MKNLIKSLLATLMLMGLFSTNVFAVTTEEMLAQKCSPAMQALKASSWGLPGHVDEDCKKPQQQVQVKNIEPKKVVKKVEKKPGQFHAEDYGFYAVILEYGVEEGLQKILAYGNNVRGWERKKFNTFSRIDKYFNSISRNEIKVGAEKFSVREDVKKFLENSENLKTASK